jgi:hypothetical protein
MPAAQHATIGARICTAKASRTIGSNFRSHRRMNQSTFFGLSPNHAAKRVSRLTASEGCGKLALCDAGSIFPAPMGGLFSPYVLHPFLLLEQSAPRSEQNSEVENVDHFGGLLVF